MEESARLHPVAQMALRRAIEDVGFGAYQVPRGEYVLAARCVSHLMAEVFPNPLAYRPRRFERGNAAESLEANRLIGLGGGMHRYIGVNFACLETKVVVALLARRYDMQPLDPPRLAGGSQTRWPTRVRYRVRIAAPGRRAPEAAAVMPAEAAPGSFRLRRDRS